MPAPPSSNIARLEALIIVGSAEMPEDAAEGSEASGDDDDAAAADASAPAPAPCISASIAFWNAASPESPPLAGAGFLLPPPAFLPPRPLAPFPPPFFLACLSSFACASLDRSARTSASSSPTTTRIFSSLFGSKVPPPSSPVTYPPRVGSSSLYVLNSLFSAPSAMSRVGKGGRKSLPTSIERRTKSSTILSQSYSNGSRSATVLNSWSRYSRSKPTWRSRKPSSVGLLRTSLEGCPRSPPPNLTTSRRRQKCGSCVTSASMMRSASRP